MIEKHYNYDIHLEKKTTEPNGIGGYIEAWEHYMTILGKIRRLNATERLTADKNTIVSTHRLYASRTNSPLLNDAFLLLSSDVKLDESASIERKYRIIYKGKIYRIISVDNPFNAERFLQVDLELVD